MGTIAKYKLNGVETAPPREWRDMQILATFETRDDGGSFLADSVQPNITTSEFSFVNTSNNKPVNAIDNFFAATPTEGMPFEIGIVSATSTGTVSYGAFTGYLDFRTLQYKSDIERICGVKQDNGLATLDQRLRGITMELLVQKNAIGPSEYAHLPYIVENRKTLLEQAALLLQAYVIVKTGYDEVHKFLNIASDIPTLGVVTAFTSLTVSITALILLTQQLVDLIQSIQESFFPPIRYHKGIYFKKAIEKAVGYCGYDLECGSFDTIFSKVALCPSKNDEVGLTTPTSGLPGILKPSDFGYVTSDLFTLANMMFYTKVAIIGTTVHLRPYNDPFWVQSSTFVMPNVKIEQAFVNNGIKRPNYDELKSSRILQYTTDDSDLWTLTTVAEQISVTTVTPVNVTNQNRVLLTGSEKTTIPYALAVRKDGIVDELLALFNVNALLAAQIKTQIEFYFNSVQSILGSSFPDLAFFVDNLPERAGCMKVENHFFSTPKVVYLDPTTKRIPTNYADRVGSVALNTTYHSYKSFVEGIRNPLDLGDTNSKYIYEGVRIPFGIDDFNQLTTNSFFTTVNGDIGKFTSILWTPDKDSAVTNFWVQDQWATNIEENTI